MKLDPWDDAELLARRLQEPGAKLIVAIGALAWCEKCRVLYPDFETAAAASADDETHVWLDLEQHAEFLGDFIPDDLPWQLVYEGARLIGAAVVTTEGSDYRDLEDPGVRERLVRADWAQ